MLQGQTRRLEVTRVLGFRNDPDRAAGLGALPLRDIDHFLEGQYSKLPAEGVIAKRQPFLRSQCFDLGEREILGKPAGLGHPIDSLGRLAVGKFGMSGDVGCVGNVRLVPRNQHAVFGRNEIRLNVIGAQLYRKLIGGERVLRSISRRAAMTQDQRFLAVQRG